MAIAINRYFLSNKNKTIHICYVSHPRRGMSPSLSLSLSHISTPVSCLSYSVLRLPCHVSHIPSFVSRLMSLIFRPSSPVSCLSCSILRLPSLSYLSSPFGLLHHSTINSTVLYSTSESKFADRLFTVTIKLFIHAWLSN